MECCEEIEYLKQEIEYLKQEIEDLQINIDGIKQRLNEWNELNEENKDRIPPKVGDIYALGVNRRVLVQKSRGERPFGINVYFINDDPPTSIEELRLDGWIKLGNIYNMKVEE
jgi:hypothetical protein